MKKLYALILIALFACQKTDIEPTYKSQRIYTIKQGNNYSDGLNFYLKSYTFYQTFSITPNQDCYYNLGNDDNYDINKFYGVKWGLDPDKNSFRIGWNCAKQNGKIQYYYYIHNKGVRNPGPNDDYYKTLLFEEYTGIEVTFVLEFIYSKGVVVRSSHLPNELLIPFDFEGVTRTVYWCWFYWGGNTKCPQTMHVLIKDKDY